MEERRGSTWCQPESWGHLATVLLAHWVTRLRSTTISCIHLVSYAFMFASPASAHFFARILFQYLVIPHLCLSATCCTHAVSIYISSPPLSTTSCMHRDLSSMSKLHLSSLNNFLRPHLVSISTFPFYAMCFSTSCINLVSASPQLLAFMLFQYPNFPCTLVPFSNFLHAFVFNTSVSPSLDNLFPSASFNFYLPPQFASHQTS